MNAKPRTKSDLRAGPREWIGLAALALPTLLVSVDMTVVYLALPQLAADLQPSSSQLLWITDIYGFIVAGSAGRLPRADGASGGAWRDRARPDRRPHDAHRPAGAPLAAGPPAPGARLRPVLSRRSVSGHDDYHMPAGLDAVKPTKASTAVPLERSETHDIEAGIA